MISLLHGTIAEKGPESVIVDAGGVGYEVFVPAGLLLELGAVGAAVRLRTHLDVKDDALVLYGFTTREQLEMFRMLISVGNVGPRSALAVLSVLDVAMVVHAIRNEDVKTFTTVPGIGKKTGQRIIIDLAEKVAKRWGPGTGASLPVRGPEGGPTGGVWELAREALAAQGFKAPEVEERLAWARKKLGDRPDIQAVVVEALRFRR